jgi:hypothetical protein
MLGAIKRTYKKDTKLYNESCATYYKLLVAPLLKENNIPCNKSLKTHSTIVAHLKKKQKTYERKS